MRDRWGYRGIYVIEAVVFLACIAGMLFFYRIRHCPLDIPFLILWGVVLLAFVPLVIRGEIQLYREEKQNDQMREPHRKEKQTRQVQEGKIDDRSKG